MLILFGIYKCYKLPNAVYLLWFALISAHCIKENVLQYLYDANLIKTSSIKMRQRTGLGKEGNWDINISLWIFHIWIFYRYIFYYFRKIAQHYSFRSIPHIMRWCCFCRILKLVCRNWDFWGFIDISTLKLEFDIYFIVTNILS